MSLVKLADKTLHDQLISLVRDECELVTKILRHLLEVERRRLYSDFKRSSLFDYAVKELGYSEAQAHRRIQAMRLIKEMPEIEQQIADGTLSLTNAAQAQGLFNRAQRNSGKSFDRQQKKNVLDGLAGKSSREAQRELLKLEPESAIPMDRERDLSEDHIEIRMVINQATKTQLDEVRSLLGPKGVQLSLGELIGIMAEHSKGALSAKRFGKRAAGKWSGPSEGATLDDGESAGKRNNKGQGHKSNEGKTDNLSAAKMGPEVKGTDLSKDPRFISRKTKHFVWKRDKGQCRCCGTKANLQYDHVQPIALGGGSEVENLRLLCFHCNQRADIRSFGVSKLIAAKKGRSDPRSGAGR